MTTDTLTDKQINERLVWHFGLCQRDDPAHGVWIEPGTYPMDLGHWPPPDYLTGDGMLAILEVMLERGYNACLSRAQDASMWDVRLIHDQHSERRAIEFDVSLPRAVALCALAALQALEHEGR